MALKQKKLGSHPLFWYNSCVMKNHTEMNYSPKQGRFPVFIADSLNICDPVLAFDKIMEEIGIERYLKPERYKSLGRPGYSRVNMLKTILFGFMDSGYASLRELEDRCKVNIRYMYLMDYETPSYRAFGYFINEELRESIEDIFKAVVEYIRKTEHVDMQHLYIDGSKFEANANKYTWVWKKGTEKSRYKLFGKITALLDEMNDELAYTGFRIETNTEYTPEYLDELLGRYEVVAGIDPGKFAHGRGHRKAAEQRHYEKLTEYTEKLREYVAKINVCGPDRNSYSKTDPDATFMRMKEDHMRNGQLKPGYNVQIGVNSEYITGIEVFSNRTDYGTMVPFMKTMQQKHGKKYKSATADAGYERFSNYLYLEANGQISFIKPANYEQQKRSSFKKQIGRMENMTYDAEDDSYTCAQGRRLSLRRECTELQDGRYVTMAWYRCESCSGCPVREKCCQAKNADQAKELRVNKTFQELRKASLENITTEYGIYLRQCRSIQVEGAFGLLKNDFGFRRFLTRGRKNVRTELFFLALAFDLKKLWMKRDKGRLRRHLSEISAA